MREQKKIKVGDRVFVKSIPALTNDEANRFCQDACSVILVRDKSNGHYPLKIKTNYKSFEFWVDYSDVELV